METIFLEILNMSLKACYVIAVILAVRWLLKKAPKKYAFALWSVAAFRLICPVSFESAFSLFSLKPQDVKQTVAAAPQVTVAAPLTPTVVAAAPTVGGTVSAPISQAETGIEPMQLLLTAVTVVWVIGMAAMLFSGIVSCVKLKRKLRTAVLLRDNVWQSEQVRSPFIFGLIHPKIYIPYGLSDASLEHVLAHERCHLRYFDHVTRLAAYLVLSLHWFNPLVWLAFILMSRDMELRCDEKVLTQMHDGVSYSETLLAFASNQRVAVLAPLAFGESAVKTRIKNALSWKKPRVWLTVLAVLVCITVIAACAADPKEPTQELAQKTEQKQNEQQEEKLPAEEDYSAPVDTAVDSDPVPETEEVASDFEKQTAWVAREVLLQPFYSSYFALQGNSGKVYYLGGTAFIIADQNSGETLITQKRSEWNWDELTQDHWLWTCLMEAELVEENDPAPLLMELEDNYFLLKLPGRLCVGKESRNRNLTELYGLQPYGDPARCEMYSAGEDGRQWLMDLIWYEDGYDYNHSVNGMIRAAGDMTMQLVPTWECGSLSVRLEYYEAQNGRLVPELETVELQRNADGFFQLTLDHKNENEYEQLIVMVPYKTGEFAVRILFEAKTKDPLKVAAADMSAMDLYAGHEILDSHTLVACGTDAESSYEQTTVYAMMGCYVENTELVYWLPTVLTYRVEEDGCENIGFWQPEEYEDYMSQIDRMFPEIQLDEEKASLLHEKAMNARIDHLLTLVHAYGSMYPDMKTVLKAFSDEYEELLSYGDQTLLRIYDYFLDGNETGVKGDFMRLLMDQLTGDELAVDAANGQEYFNAWMAHVQKLADENGEAWMKAHMREAWLLLQIINS